MKKLTHSCFKTILLGVSAAMSANCAPDQSVRQIEVYYPDGTLRMVKSMQGNLLHGRSRAFFPGGRLKSDSRWVNGKRTGVTVLYYPNGVRMDSSHFVNDSLDGASLSFYRNGTVKHKAYFTQGIPAGVTLLFDSTSKLVERQVYEPSGKLVYKCNYDKNGKAFSHVLYPITEAPDTISLGEAYAGCVRFAYPLTGKVSMLVGTLETHPESADRFQIVDTIARVQPDPRGRFCFAYRPAKPGAAHFSYKFLHTGNLVDSLSLDEMTGSKPFFVNSQHETQR